MGTADQSGLALLADHPTMPLREDRPLPPIRILVNLILREQARGQQ